MKKDLQKAIQKYKVPVVAVDMLILSIIDKKLCVVLISMKKKPFEGSWAVPGGIILKDEHIDDAARRHLEQKTNVKDVFLDQLYTFGAPNRDPFGRVVSVAYYALIPHDKVSLKTTDRYGGIEWFPVDKLPKMAYDHKDIIKMATKRLQSKLTYSNIMYSLLPKEFTLAELRTSYETILKRTFDKRNFRKKVLSLDMLIETDKKQVGVPNRPAKLYKFKNRKFKEFEIL